MVSDFDFLNNIWPQNCGDSLKILKKSDNKLGKEFLWECEFIQYPCKILSTKGNVLKGQMINPQIEQIEFVDKIWHQNCGDSLKILGKSEEKRNQISLFECEFIQYPCKVLASKRDIKIGTVNNPQIEIEEFIKKEWKQNCGDIIKIKEKMPPRGKGNSTLFKCEFQKYPSICLATKKSVIRGEVFNIKLPWNDKENLIKYIQENFQEKPTLQKLAKELNISYSHINHIINKFQLNYLINHDYQEEENQLKGFIESFYKGKIIKYIGKKEDKYKEIDIYFPELKRGIEYNGFNWHEEGNPNNPYSKPIGYHKEKQELFAKKGIEILFVWDYEWFEDYPKRQVVNEQIKQRIKNFILS